MLENIIKNIKIQTYTILLSIPSIATLFDGVYNLNENLSLNESLETLAGICLFSFVRASYKRQKKRYNKLSKIYDNHGINNFFDFYVHSTICERKIVEVVLKEKNENESWKKLKKKYPYYKVVIEQLR